MEVEYMENPIVPPWLELPSEITSMILQKLGTIDILKNADKVCTTWHQLCQEPDMWQVIKLQNANTDDFWDSKDALEKIYHPAVDRSQGQLIDISIDYYGIENMLNYMLNYVAQRSPQLKRLELICSYNVFGDELSASVKKFPLLEEL
ncbi:F-box protein SKIP19-like [Solanum tuberosum]|uniref:Ubiquitin-protein ligase n=1 Tax=Solanum tuberosum TaxID=4113 RepID=M1A5A7_SOLTU|nr:PREDICTED: F-box protein SKIP19-like [Solanum tuberosum]